MLFDSRSDNVVVRSFDSRSGAFELVTVKCELEVVRVT